MARAKKPSTKPKPDDNAKTQTDDAAETLSEDVPDAVIVEEHDQSSEAQEVEPQKSDLEEATELTEPPVADDQPADDPAPTAPPAAPSRSGPGFFALFLGGACAAALGFGASQYIGNESWPFAQGPSEVEGLAAQIEEQATRIETLSTNLAQLDERLTAAAADRSLQEQVEQTAQTLSGAIDVLAQRTTDLENRPIPDVGATRDAVTAYQDQLAAMRAMFEKELERIEASQAEAVEQEQSAASLAKTAMVRASVAQLQSAIDSGAPYADVLQTLTDAGVEIPSVLAQSAEDGVPTLAALQQSYPAAARGALNAAVRAQADSGEVDSFTAFLRTQLGTRSLEPKEGGDPDAILSRSEAALRDGNLARALSELEALPEAGAVRMADWIAVARAREDAVAATAALAETTNN